MKSLVVPAKYLAYLGSCFDLEVVIDGSTLPVLLTEHMSHSFDLEVSLANQLHPI